MKLNLIPQFSARGRTLFLSVLMTVIMAACGGGSGSPGAPLGGSGSGSGGSGSGSSGGATPPATGKVGSISFISSNPSNAAIVFQGTGGPGRTSTASLIYKVLDTTGNPLPNVKVTFSSTSSTLATISPASASTDKDGLVTTAVTAVGATGTPPTVPLPGTLTVTASAPGSGSTTVTAISNQVIVATGIPVAKSFTISPAVSNVEGWDFPNTTTTIAVSVADANGNPAVDGTAVSAHTNEGAIETSNSANPGCTTINGICTLVFNSQNPKWVVDPTTGAYTDVGIATISLSATDGSGTAITGSVQLTQSGSWPSIFVQTGTNTWELVAAAAVPQADVNQLSYSAATSSCNGGGLEVVLSDEVGNPLAFGTTVGVSTPAGSTLTIGTTLASIGNTPLFSLTDFIIPIPASQITNIQYLNNYGPTGAAAYNPAIHGTSYPIPFKISNCDAAGIHTTTAVLTIATKSVQKDSITFNIYYTYPSP